MSRFCSSYVKLELWRSKAYALSPLSLSPSDSGTQAPLGAGFGNPFASGVGTNLGSSSLGGTTSVRVFSSCFIVDLFSFLCFPFLKQFILIVSLLEALYYNILRFDAAITFYFISVYQMNERNFFLKTLLTVDC